MTKRTKFSLRTTIFTLVAIAATPAIAQANSQHVYKFDIQTAVPAGTFTFKIVQKFANRLKVMSNGQLDPDVLPSGAVVGPFNILDAVSEGVVKAGSAWGNYWSGKNPSFVLFANVPAVVGMDQRTLVSWYYNGGGEALYDELDQKIMHLNVKPFLAIPEGPDALGWFKKPIHNMAEFKTFKYRSPPGIPGKTYEKMGIAAVALPAASIIPSAHRGVIDAAEWVGPAADKSLGLEKVFKYYYLQGLHQATDVGEIDFNTKFYNSLPANLQEMIRTAILATVAQSFNDDISENAKALHNFVTKDGVHVEDTPADYYPAFFKANEPIVDHYVKAHPFFRKVMASQIKFAKLVYPYRSRILTLFSKLVTYGHKTDYTIKSDTK